MKKILRILTIAAALTAAVLLTACKQFLDDPEDFFAYWSTESYVKDYTIDKVYKKDAKDLLYIPSSEDIRATVKLHNPNKFTFTMPTSSADAGKVIRFPGLSLQPESGTDYTLKQTAPDTLILTYKKAFLQAHEWSNGNIGAELTLVSTDGRKFNRKFDLSLKVDTAPILEYAGIGKTSDTDGNHYYVLLFRAKDMDTMIGGQSVHKDINTMNITAGGVLLPAITLSVTGTDFATGGDLLAPGAVSTLDSAHPLPAGSGLLRLKTEVKLGGAVKTYAVSIKDAQGLSSNVIEVSTQKNKLSDVELFDGLTAITGTTESNPKTFAGISGKILTAKTVQSGAGITGIIYKKNGSSWMQIGSETVSGTTSAAVNLPALAADENEALYKITLKAKLSGYDDSNEKPFFIKLLWRELPVLKLMQDFNHSDLYLHCISAAAKGYVSEDIVPDAGSYDAAKPLLIYSLNEAAKFVLSPRADSGATVKYKLNGGAETPAAGELHISLTGAASFTLNVWAEKDSVAGPKITVHIKVINAVTAYGELKNVVKNSPAGNEIQINIDGNLTAPSGDTEIAVSGGKNLKLIPKSGSPIYTINADGNGRIFKISGSGTELNLVDIKLIGGNADIGGAAYVENSGILVLTGNTLITPSTGDDTNTRGKNDVYLANGTTIKVVGTLTSNEPIIARITPEQYSDTNTVLTGDITAGTVKNYTRFSVTPQDSEYVWKIKSDGKLQKLNTTVNGSDSGAWEKLLRLVQDAPKGSTITINGEIKATSDFGNSGEIVIDKDLTIKGKNVAVSDILNANSDGANAPAAKHRIFNVASGVTLTLENLTLTGGKAAGTGAAGDGGAIYASGTTVILTNCIIKGNEAQNGGAIYATKDSSTASTVIIKGCTIGGTGSGEANKADGKGGGIYVGGKCTLTLQNGADGNGAKIIGNTATNGGGVYIASGGTLNLRKGQLSFNRVTDTPKEGIAVYNDNGTFNWTGGTIENHGTGGSVIYGHCNNTSGHTAN